MGLFLFLSVLIHLVLFFLIRDGLQYWNSREPEEPKPVWVDLKKMAPPPPEIVDIPKPQQESVPDRPSAQSLYNQSVKEETVAPTSQPPAPPPAPKAPKPEPPAEKPKEPGKAEPQKNKTIEELYSKKTEAEEPKKAPQPERIPGMPEASDKPSEPSGDFVPNYKLGNRTYINTEANPQVAYYVELKRKFRSAWSPIPIVRAHAHEITRNRIDVVVGVSVAPNGQLADLTTIRSSGFGDYDREAKRAIQASAPFTSPPTNIIGPDGMLHTAWTFVIYMR